MSTLFLDIDGVLNSVTWFEGAGGRAAPGGDPWQRMIDPAAVARLNRIVRGARPLVVLSSSWRRAFSLPEVESTLQARGFVGRLADATPTRDDGRWRGAEIAAWLACHSAENRPFAILDDGLGFGPLSCRLVRTSSRTGLLDRHVDQVLRLLAG